MPLFSPIAESTELTPEVLMDERAEIARKLESAVPALKTPIQSAREHLGDFGLDLRESSRVLANLVLNASSEKLQLSALDRVLAIHGVKADPGISNSQAAINIVVQDGDVQLSSILFPTRF